MSFESPQPQFNEENKEAALRKSKVFKMREEIQARIMLATYGENDEAKAAEAIHKWVETHANDEYTQAFNDVLDQHPDLLEIYENNKDEVLAIVRDAFDHIHQPA